MPTVLAAHAEHHHPYFPRALVLDGYRPPPQSPLVLVAVMGAAIGTVLVATRAAFSTRRVRGRPLERTDQLVAMWFVLCAALHCLYELYYLAHFRSLASAQDVLASTWKEYAKSDSRYLAQVPLVFMLESITVCVTGPLCAMAAHAIWTQSPAARHLAQLCASLLHLHSVVLYFGTELMAPESSCRPEPLYYYGYFVAMNMPWLLVPLALAAQSIAAITHAMRIAHLACGKRLYKNIKAY